MDLDKKILSDITIYAKYARFIPEEERRETWDEIVDRNMNMHIKKFPFMEEEIKAVYNRSVRPLKVLPSARSLQFAGKAIEVNPCRMYNCCFTGVDHPDVFSEASFLLLGGTGFGFSVQKYHIDKLPPIMGVEKPIGKQSKKRYLIGDSIEGWSDAFKVLVESYFYGKREIDFDYREIRKKGTRLVTAGGKAPGPEPLRKALTQIVTVFENAIQERGVGTKLKSIEVHDMICIIADAVRSGGIRRSACISLFDRDDEDMLTCKHGEWWIHHPYRALANNSAVLPYSKVTLEDFNQIWKAVELSGSGEPGISWTNEEHIGGYNPCFTKGTLVHTKEGHFPIEELVGKEVEIHDGNGWVTVDNFRVTGENQRILRVELQDGTLIDTTHYHKYVLDSGNMVEAQNLCIGDKLMISTAPIAHGKIKAKGAYIKGFLIGDGTVSKSGAMLYLYEPKYGCADRIVASAKEIPIGEINTNALTDLDYVVQESYKKNKLTIRKSLRGLTVRSHELQSYGSIYKTEFPKEVFSWDHESKCEFIAGIMDSDGGAHCTKNGWMYQISSIHLEWLLGFQILLKTIGVPSKVVQYKNGGMSNFNDGYGEYPTQDAYRLTISQEGSIILANQVTFTRLTSFADKKTTYKQKPRWNSIVSITEVSMADKVYCCTVPTNHTFSLSCGIRIGQCHEVFLQLNQFCNLTEVNSSIITTQEQFNQASKDAAFIGTLQASYTNFHYLRPIWRETTEEEMLIGAGATGIASPEFLLLDETEAALCVVEENKRVATLLGINSAARTTVVKPAGTTSLIFSCSSGIHAWHNDYYIRRITLGKDEAIAQYLMTMHPEIIEQSEYDPKEIKVCIPQKAPDGAMIRTEDVITTLERVKRYNLNWVRAGHISGKNFNNVSTTISVKDNEWEKVGKWMWDNRFDYHGIAVLPYNGGTYKQAPFEDITKEEYEERLKHLLAVELKYIIEQEDNTDMTGEVACAGGACTVA
jgi:ribonucleotide reductase, class II